MIILGIFNNREISVILWSIVLLVVVSIKQKGFGKSLRSLAETVLRMWRYFLLLIMYVGTSIFFLYRINIWDISYIKITIFWFFGSALVMFINSMKFVTEKSYLKKIIIDTIGVTVLVSFVSNFYSFSLWLELLLVPFVALLAGMLAVASFKHELKRVGKLSKWSLTGLGLFVLLTSLYKTIVHFDSFAKISTLQEFIIPILLSIMFVPFTYVLSLYGRWNQKKTGTNEFSLKQKFYLHFFRSKQYLYIQWSNFKYRISLIVDSFLFYILVFCVALFLTQKTLLYLNVNLTQEYLLSLGFAIAGIIGASIAIIFSFSTFILQSTSDLFSTRYLDKFIQDKKEKYIFWLLVILTFFSFLTPIIMRYSVIEILVTILFSAFLLIYSLYRELRQKVNPETTLTKIRNDAVIKLSSVNKELKKHAYIQDKIFEHDDNGKSLSVAVQYKSNTNWNVQILENVKHLYEIGLRLLSKNEINSFNLTLKYIYDIYVHHLSLRNSHIMRIPSGMWGSYTFEDEGFTTKILEYFESISNRLIQEKRKESLYYLLSIFEGIIINTQALQYADKNIGSQGENPILSLVLSYYIGFTDELADSKERDWIWEVIKSLSKVSRALLESDYNHYNYSQITEAINKVVASCALDKEKESFVQEVANIYFDQIKLTWNRYTHNEIFWNDLLKNLKKATIVLSLAGGINLSLSGLFISFHEWQVNVINEIFKLEDKDKQIELKNAYLEFMKRWSDFLLDLARDFGLQDKQFGLPIIQSVENNLRIIYGIKNKFKVDVTKIYETQFNILSWYFHKTETVDESFLFNLDNIEETLLNEINNNLSEEVFDIKEIIKLYVQLVQQHFDKVSVGYGYNHPRVIEKLISLGLILTKYNCDTTDIIKLIEEINKRYLVLNKK